LFLQLVQLLDFPRLVLRRIGRGRFPPAFDQDSQIAGYLALMYLKLISDFTLRHAAAGEAGNRRQTAFTFHHCAALLRHGMHSWDAQNGRLEA
jgi:hypothetical protein